MLPRDTVRVRRSDFDYRIVRGHLQLRLGVRFELLRAERLRQQRVLRPHLLSNHWELPPCGHPTLRSRSRVLPRDVLHLGRHQPDLPADVHRGFGVLDGMLP